ncbi:MAG: hypothetical protein EA422_10120 [Gemmatimonadales bacterium]|nr:MAG: hypothetical protein EA422_10120 [Gemmatimonadales bacterium]
MIKHMDPKPRVGPPNAVILILAYLLLPIGSEGTVTPLLAQETRHIPVSLEEVRRIAAEGHPEVQAAQARAQGAFSQWDGSRAYRRPSVGVEWDALRTNDPVAAFGSRLRQGRFTEADFSPDRLNRPDALGDWAVGVGAEWAPFDPAATSAARAAQALAQAAGLGAEWVAEAAAYGAELHYLESVAAESRLAAVEASAGSARENLRVTTRRVEEGLATEGDLFQAQAGLENARAQVIRAEREIHDARERLGLALGWERGQIPVPVEQDMAALPDLPVPARGDVAVELEGRPDLLASMAHLEASAERVREARRARLPSMEGFARVGTHSQAPFGGAETNWMVGFRVRVPLYSGGGLTDRIEALDAERLAHEREHDFRVREAEVEVSEAVRALASAHEGVEVARAAARASGEAARLMRRRYEENLVTAADLMAVEARAAQDAVGEVDAAANLAMAAARVRFLSGVHHAAQTRSTSPAHHDVESTVPMPSTDPSLNLGDNR